MPRVDHPGFTGGEIGQDLYGRADLPIYAKALRWCRNMLVLADGSLVKRPGTDIVDAQTTTDAQIHEVRLIPFVAADNEAYVLVFENEIIRLMYEGAPLDDGGPVTVVTDYLDEDLQRLHWVQSGDVMTLMHPDYPTMELVRTDHVTWAIAAKVFGPEQAAPTAPGNTLLDVATTPLKPWSWAITAVSETGDESVPLDYTPAASHVEADTPAAITWTAASGAALYKIYRGQSGRKGFVGYATASPFRDDGQEPDYGHQPPTGDDTLSTADNYPRTGAYHDDRLVFGGTNLEPATVQGTRPGNYRNVDRHIPPQADDGVKFALAARQYEDIRGLVSIGAGLVVLTNSMERLMSGGADGEPMTATSVKAQIRSHYGSADIQPLVAGDEAFYIQERGSRVRDLFHSTERGGYVGNDLTVYARHLFASTYNNDIRDMAYQRDSGILWVLTQAGRLYGMTYIRDLDVYAWHRHDLGGEREVDLVSDDDLRGSNRTAIVEAICVVPDGNEDSLYLSVARCADFDDAGVPRYRTIEQMGRAAKLWPNSIEPQIDPNLDCRLMFSGRSFSVDIELTIVDAGGGNYTVTSDTAGTFTAGQANRDYIYLGTELAAGDRPDARLLITAFTSDTEVTVQAVAEQVIEGEPPGPAADPPGVYVSLDGWVWARRDLSSSEVGDLYDGFTLDALQDGYFTTPPPTGIPNTDDGEGGITVVGQDLELPAASIETAVGFRIYAEMATLDLPADKGQAKIVTHIGMLLSVCDGADWFILGEPSESASSHTMENSVLTNDLPTLFAGSSDNDTQYVGRNGNEPATIDAIERETAGSWNRRGRSMVRHIAPLPFHILGFWRQVEKGD